MHSSDRPKRGKGVRLLQFMRYDLETETLTYFDDAYAMCVAAGMVTVDECPDFGAFVLKTWRAFANALPDNRVRKIVFGGPKCYFETAPDSNVIARGDMN